MASDLVEVGTFTASVTVPDDGDDYLASTVEIPFQALTNRTRYLQDLLTGLGTADVELASGTSLIMKGITGIAYDVLKARTIPIPLDSIVQMNPSALWFAQSIDPAVEPNRPGGYTSASGAIGRWSWRMPHGALVKHIRAAILNPGVGPGPITLDVYQRRNGTSGSYLPVSTKIGTATISTAGTTLLDADCAALAVAADGALDTFYAVITSGATGQWIDHVSMEFGDPGPRNF